MLFSEAMIAASVKPLCPLVTKFYMLPYMLCSCDFARCRCDVDFRRILVLSKGGNLQSTILFMLSTAAAIFTQTKPYEIAMSMRSFVKLNFSRLSVCLHNAPPQRHQMTSHNVILLTSLARYIMCHIKFGMRSLCGQLTCALFYQTNKHHIYDTPL